MHTLLSILLLFICTFAYADNPPETIYDEGVRKGTAFNINCVGAGITCSQSGITGTITVSGGGGGGSGTVNSGTAGYAAYYASTGTAVSENANLIFTAAGNIGIGTAGSNGKLDVNGNVFIENSNFLNLSNQTLLGGIGNTGIGSTGNFPGLYVYQAPHTGILFAPDIQMVMPDDLSMDDQSSKLAWFPIKNYTQAQEAASQNTNGLYFGIGDNGVGAAGNYTWGAHFNCSSNATGCRGFVVGLHGPSSTGISVVQDDPNNTSQPMHIYQGGANSNPAQSLIQVDAAQNVWTGAVQGTFTGNFVNLNNATTNVFNINSNGNVGIGTAPVNTPLEIYAAAPTIQLESNNAAGYITFDSNTDLRHWRFGSSNSGEAIFGVANKFFIYDANAFAMRTVWDGNGNVGIGSVNPGTKIDIAGDARMTGFNMPTGASSGYVLTSNSVGIGTWAASSSGSGSGTVNSGTAGQVAFYPSSTTAVNGTSALFINGSGNVGFGSAVPGSKLDVNGTARVFGNIGIGTASPGVSIDITGSARLSNILSFTQGSQFVDQNGLAFSKALGTDSSNRNYFAITGTLHNATNATTTGLFVTASTGTAGTGTIFGISGRAIPAHTSGTNSNVYGVFGQNQINGSGGTTTNSFGVWGTTALMTAGTLKNDYAAGFYGPVVVQTGNVGIGTLLPIQQLDVQGTVSLAHVVIDSSGNMGINSTAPGQKLDVQGTIRMIGMVSFAGNNIKPSVKTAANQACNTTCTLGGCFMGEDTSVLGSFVDCADATADRCICLDGAGG